MSQPIPTSPEVEAAMKHSMLEKLADGGMTAKSVDQNAAVHLLDQFQRIREAQHRATLLSASPEPQGMEQAVEALATELYHDDEYGYCREGAECRHCQNYREMYRRKATRYLQVALPFLPPAGLPDVEAGGRMIHGGEYNETWEQLSDGEKEWYRGRYRLAVAPLEAKVKEMQEENEALASAVRAAADDTKGYLDLIGEMAAITEVVRRYCPSDETTGVTEEFAFVCHDEDGEPIVEANTLPEAVTQLLACMEATND